MRVSGGVRAAHRRLERLLREKAQVSACKELLRVLARSLNTRDKEEGEAGANTQHLQVRDIETYRTFVMYVC